MIRRILQFYADGLLCAANENIRFVMREVSIQAEYGTYPKGSIVALQVDLASNMAALQFDLACCLIGLGNPLYTKGKK